jgi:serine/threonine-protein kinase
MDFGLAMKEGMKQEEELYGTVEYVSPEQIEGGAIDGRSDLYSLGITAFELLTGFVPFRDDDPYAVISMHMRESVPSVRRFVPDCPLDLAQFVHKATRRDPGERFQSASEARESLHGTETEPGRRKRRMAVEYNAKLDSQVEPIWRKMRQRLEGIPGLQFVEDRASATTED